MIYYIKRVLIKNLFTIKMKTKKELIYFPFIFVGTLFCFWSFVSLCSWLALSLDLILDVLFSLVVCLSVSFLSTFLLLLVDIYSYKDIVKYLYRKGHYIYCRCCEIPLEIIGVLQGSLLVAFFVVFPLFRRIYRLFLYVLGEDTPVSTSTSLGEDTPVSTSTSLGEDTPISTSPEQTFIDFYDGDTLEFFTSSVASFAWATMAWYAIYLWRKKSPSKDDFIILVSLVFWFFVSFFCGCTYPFLTLFSTFIGVVTPIGVILWPTKKEKQLSLQEKFTIYVTSLAQEPKWLSMQDFWLNDFLKRKQEKLEYLVVEILWLLSISFYNALRTKYQPLETILLFILILKAFVGHIFGLLLYLGVILILIFISINHTLSNHLKAMYGPECFRKLGWNAGTSIPISTTEKLLYIGVGFLLPLVPALFIGNNADEDSGDKRSQKRTAALRTQHDEDQWAAAEFEQKYPGRKYVPYIPVCDDIKRDLLNPSKQTPSAQVTEKLDNIASVLKKVAPNFGNGVFGPFSKFGTGPTGPEDTGSQEKPRSQEEFDRKYKKK